MHCLNHHCGSDMIIDIEDIFMHLFILAEFSTFHVCLKIIINYVIFSTYFDIFLYHKVCLVDFKVEFLFSFTALWNYRFFGIVLLTHHQFI